MHMDNVKIFINKYYKLLILLIFLISFLIGASLYKLQNYTYLTVEFTHLKPLHGNINVYFNGYKIGRVIKIAPADDYRTTLVEIVLYPDDLKLPSNITAEIRSEKHHRHRKDYIEIVYPDNPSQVLIQSGEMLIGRTTVDMESYLASQDPETLDEIKNQLASSAQNLNFMLEQLGNIFQYINEVLAENRPYIDRSFQNLAISSENLREMSRKLNNSLNQQTINNTVTNLGESTDYTKNSLQNVEKLTLNINKSIEDFNCMLPQVAQIINNSNCIVKKVRKSLEGKSILGFLFKTF